MDCNHHHRLAGLLILLLALLPLSPLAAATISSEKGPVVVETVASGLNHPWGLAVLPDGALLVTERSGHLRLISPDGRLSDPLDGVPAVDAQGQGGLLDIALDPDFARTGWVYLSFAEAGAGGNSTAVARGRLTGSENGQPPLHLTGTTVIFRQLPKVASTAHFGSRLVFDRTGHLFITLGERFRYDVRVRAQTLDNDIGKVVRINPDGTIPSDNPFVGRAGARPEIWSYGHRNVQGAAIDPVTGDLWTGEHGPLGGDEINITRPGGNYGWPVVSFGTNYDGTPVGTGRSHQDGMIDPIYHWTPVIAASGMRFYSGTAFPGWAGNLLVSGLQSQGLVRLERDGARITHEERLDLGARIRDVVEGPGGVLYVLTDDSDGQVLRLRPGP